LEIQETVNRQGNAQKKSNAGSIRISDFKLYYKAITIKKAWYWHKKRYVDRWNRIEDQVMSTHSYAQLIFDKVTKNKWWRIDGLFNKCCWEKWLSACKTLKIDLCLSPCTSINSKWIKDLNIRPKTPKLLQERAGNTLEAIGIGKDFLNRSPAAQQLRERMKNNVSSLNCITFYKWLNTYSTLPNYHPSFKMKDIVSWDMKISINCHENDDYQCEIIYQYSSCKA
jgi:hypothetical protein